jgi:hypothetical protein
VKALPLWQPWASLVAVGAKRIETRHWRAPASLMGQRIAIHATKRTSELWLCEEEPFSEYVVADELPLGAVIATVVLDRCREMTAESIATLERANPHEAAFGLYEVGRFAWVLRDVERLAVPVPFRGSQGIFDVPDHLLGAAVA